MRFVIDGDYAGNTVNIAHAKQPKSLCECYLIPMYDTFSIYNIRRCISFSTIPRTVPCRSFARFFLFHSCIRSDAVVTVDGGNLSHHIVCMRTMTTWTVFIHIQFLINPWDQCILVSVQKLTFQFRYMHLTHFQRAGCWVFSKTQCCIVMCCSADTLRWRIVWLFTFVQIPTGKTVYRMDLTSTENTTTTKYAIGILSTAILWVFLLFYSLSAIYIWHTSVVYFDLFGYLPAH